MGYLISVKGGRILSMPMNSVMLQIFLEMQAIWQGFPTSINRGSYICQPGHTASRIEQKIRKVLLIKRLWYSIFWFYHFINSANIWRYFTPRAAHNGLAGHRKPCYMGNINSVKGGRILAMPNEFGNVTEFIMELYAMWVTWRWTDSVNANRYQIKDCSNGQLRNVAVGYLTKPINKYIILL